MDSIRAVDDAVKQIETMISDFYGDKNTAYIFTSDHGMSPIGNHGDGGVHLPWLYILH
jgi:GPI ethanolamine phosphate transferase 1